MLTVVCVFAMILGGLGLLTSVFGAVGMLAGRLMMQQGANVAPDSPGMLSLAAVQIDDSAAAGESTDDMSNQNEDSAAEQNPFDEQANTESETDDMTDDDMTDDDMVDDDTAEDDGDNPFGGSGPPDLGDMMAQNQAMQEAMMKIQNEWFPFLVTVLVVKFIVCLLMSVGGVLGIMDKPLGRTLMIASFIGVIVLELGQLVPNYLIQQETATVMAEHFDNVMDAVGNGPKVNMGGMMKMIGTVQTILSAGWGVFKIGLFAWFLFYLMNADVKKYYRIVSGQEEFSPEYLPG